MQRVGDALRTRFVRHGAEMAVAYSGTEWQYLFDRPFVVTPGQLRIHAHIRAYPVDIARAEEDTPEVRVAWQLHNDGASALEHEVWEELALTASVSTINPNFSSDRSTKPG